jgi:hypothetical protein
MAKSTPEKLAYMAKYQDTPENIKKREARNTARRHDIKKGLVKVGDSKQVDHIKPLGAGGAAKDSNTRVISRARNESWRKGESGYKAKKV